MSFCVAGVALCNIPRCFMTCQKSFCVAGAILLPRLQKMRCIFRSRRSTLDTSAVIFAWQAQHSRRVVLPMFCESQCQGCATWWRSPLHTLHFYTPPLQPTLYTPHTLHFALYTLRSLHFLFYILHFILHTLHFALYTLHWILHTLHFTIPLYILHFILHTLHFTLDTPHFTLYNPTLHSTLYTPHCTLYTQHSTLYTLHSTLHTLHPTLDTPHFALYTPHFTLHTLYFTPRTLHSTLCILYYTLYTPLCTLHFALHTLHLTLHTFHSTLFTPHLHFTLYKQHFTLYTPHFTLHTLHFTPHTWYSTLYTLTLYTPHFILFNLHSTLHTPHFALPTMIPGFVIIRVSIRVCGFHLVFFCLWRRCRNHFLLSLSPSSCTARRLTQDITVSSKGYRRLYSRYNWFLFNITVSKSDTSLIMHNQIMECREMLLFYLFTVWLFEGLLRVPLSDVNLSMWNRPLARPKVHGGVHSGFVYANDGDVPGLQHSAQASWQCLLSRPCLCLPVCRAWYGANDQCKRVKCVALRTRRMCRIYAKEHGQTLLRPTGPLDPSMKPLIDSLHIEELVNAEASSNMIWGSFYKLLNRFTNYYFGRWPLRKPLELLPAIFLRANSTIFSRLYRMLSWAKDWPQRNVLETILVLFPRGLLACRLQFGILLATNDA